MGLFNQLPFLVKAKTMTTPAGYKKRYENLQVPLNTGASASVRVTNYRATFMGSGAMAVNTTAMDAFDGKFHDFAKKGFPSDIALQVDRGSGLRAVTDDEARRLYSPDYRNALRALKSVYQGKGSPEFCQIVLQLAAHWKLSGSNQASLQKYADEGLGLDCNGFAGNFIWHDLNQNDWTDHGLDAAEGPNSKIHVYQGGNFPVTSWDDVTAGPYLFLRTNESGAILDGAGDDIGHMALTEPQKFRPKNGPTPRGVDVVESSASMNGLKESMYSLDSTSKKAKDVFFLRREAIPLKQKHDLLFFKIFQLHGPPKK
jgi:hypothetical protein